MQVENDKKEILQIENSRLTSDLENITKKYIQLVNKIMPVNQGSRSLEEDEKVSDVNKEIKIKSQKNQRKNKEIEKSRG